MADFGQKTVINYDLFLAHRDEILVMKEQIHLIKIMMQA